MAGIYPHPSASATDYNVGDQVKWYVNEREISPYVGKVTEICPSVNKVWVEFPVGGNQQKDPAELILVTPFTGRSPVKKDTGYSSVEKEKSNEDYGTLREEARKLAHDIVQERMKRSSKNEEIKKMASEISYNFAEKVVDKLASDVISCVDKNMTDIQAYQHLYPKYENICSDGFMRTAIDKIYESLLNKVSE